MPVTWPQGKPDQRPARSSRGEPLSECHFESTAKKPEPQATQYRVVLQKNGTYGVEVTQPGELPIVVQSFWTEAEAETWVTAEMMSGAENGD